MEVPRARGAGRSAGQPLPIRAVIVSALIALRHPVLAVIGIGLAVRRLNQVAGRVVGEAVGIDAIRRGVHRDVQSGSAPASYILLQQVAKRVVNKRLVARDRGQPVCPTGLGTSKHLHSLLRNTLAGMRRLPVRR